VVWQWQRSRSHPSRSSRARVAPGPPTSPPATPSASHPLSDPAFVAGLRPIPSGAGTQPAWAASDITGVSPTGSRLEALIGEFDGLVLLAFLTTQCDGCDEFWRGLRDGAGAELPMSMSTVVVTKGPGTISPPAVENLATGITRAPVIMSDEAWTHYRVSGYPFFVLVDAPTRTVIGETVGFGWSDVVSMIRSAAT
jgi:hypothetical protein